MSRRVLLSRTSAAAALLAAGPVLAACGGSSSSGTSASGGGSSAAGGEVGGELDIFVWQGYDAPVPARKAWEKKEGVNVKTSYISAQQDILPKLKSPAGEGIDVSFASPFQMEVFKEAEILTPITEEEVPNLKNLFPVFNNDIYKNEEGEFLVVPFNFGWNGMVYNAEVLGDPNSWDVLMEPELTGRIGLWDDSVTTMQFAAVIHGFDPQTTTPEQFEVIKQWLTELRPQVKMFAPSLGDYMTALSNGDIDMVPNGWNATNVFVEGNREIKTKIPTEGKLHGALGWVDCMQIPYKCDNRATAAAWINQLISGDQVSVETYEGVAGGATCENVPPKLAKATRDLFPYNDLNSLFEKEAPIALEFPQESDKYVTFDETVEAYEEFKAG
ncbi:MAG: extracellular solute-binding protein [Actinobacteria bacterium]|nr:extracellular solute-binding protein [Actinomycetota bacterium]